MDRRLAGIDRLPKFFDQLLDRGRPFHRILFKGMKNHLFEFRRHCRAEFGKTRRRIADMFFHDRRYRRPLERNITGEHLIQHYAETVNIGPRIGVLVRPLLGRHIIRRTHQPGCLCLNERTQQLAGFDLCQPEIEYFDRLRQTRFVVADHDVQRLEIAVYDPLMMCGSDPGTDRRH